MRQVGWICANIVHSTPLHFWFYVPRWNWKCVSMGRWITRLCCASLFRSSICIAVWYVLLVKSVCSKHAVGCSLNQQFRFPCYSLRNSRILTSKTLLSVSLLSIKNSLDPNPVLGLVVPIPSPEFQGIIPSLRMCLDSLGNIAGRDVLRCMCLQGYQSVLTQTVGPAALDVDAYCSIKER